MRSQGLSLDNANRIFAKSLTGFFGPSKAEIAEEEKACTSSYKRERAEYMAVVTPANNWTKDGVIVIELAEKAREDSISNTANICVYENVKGTIALPGAFHQRRWLK